MFGFICYTAGYLGDFFILFAYFLLQSGRIKSDQLVYPLYNFLGAALITVSLFYRPNTPVLIIELAWMLISIYGFYVYYINKLRRKK